MGTRRYATSKRRRAPNATMSYTSSPAMVATAPSKYSASFPAAWLAVLGACCLYCGRGRGRERDRDRDTDDEARRRVRGMVATLKNGVHGLLTRPKPCADCSHLLVKRSGFCVSQSFGCVTTQLSSWRRWCDKQQRTERCSLPPSEPLKINPLKPYNKV